MTWHSKTRFIKRSFNLPKSELSFNISRIHFKTTLNMWKAGSKFILSHLVYYFSQCSIIYTVYLKCWGGYCSRGLMKPQLKGETPTLSPKPWVLAFLWDFIGDFRVLGCYIAPPLWVGVSPLSWGFIWPGGPVIWHGRRRVKWPLCAPLPLKSMRENPWKIDSRPKFKVLCCNSCPFLKNNTTVDSPVNFWNHSRQSGQLLKP
jgi:hypothetical protein